MGKPGFFKRLFSKATPRDDFDMFDELEKARSDKQPISIPPQYTHPSSTPVTMPPGAVESLNTPLVAYNTRCIISGIFEPDTSLISSLADPDRGTSFREHAPATTIPTSTIKEGEGGPDDTKSGDLQPIPTLGSLRVNELLGEVSGVNSQQDERPKDTASLKPIQLKPGERVSVTSENIGPIDHGKQTITTGQPPVGSKGLLRETAPVMPAIMGTPTNEDEQLIEMVELLRECIFFQGLSPSAERQLVDKISGFENGGIYTVNSGDWILIHPNHHLDEQSLKPTGLTILFEDGLFRSVLPPTQCNDTIYHDLGIEFTKTRGEAIGEAAFAQFDPSTSVQYIGRQPIKCMYIPTEIFNNTGETYNFPPDFAQITRIVTLRNVLRSTTFLTYLNNLATNIERSPKDQFKLEPLAPSKQTKTWVKKRYDGGAKYGTITTQTIPPNTCVVMNPTQSGDQPEHVGQLMQGRLNIYNERHTYLSTLQTPGILFGERTAILEKSTACLYTGESGAIVRWLPLTPRLKTERDSYEEDLRILIKSMMEKIRHRTLTLALQYQ